MAAIEIERTTPKVSVVLPFHNEARFLEECLQSVREQSWTDFEVLAVDDGSTDRSSEVVQKAALEDTRIRLLSPGRVGLIAALNLGLEQASGRYIARMDGDDVMHPERLAAQAEFLDLHPDIGLVGCQVRALNEITDGLQAYLNWLNRSQTPEQIADEMFVESPLAHPSVMFRRELVHQYGGYRDGDFPEDYELWLRLHSHGIRFARIPQTLLYWRDRPDRISRQDPRYSKAAFDRLRSQFLVQHLESLRRPLLIWGAGQQSRKRVRLLTAQGVKLTAWVDVDPKKIGSSLWDLPVVAPHQIGQFPNAFILNYVTNHGARDEIETYLADSRLKKGQDFLSVGA